MNLSVNELKLKAITIREDIVKMIAASQSGHPGGSLSAVEIVTALYFGGILKHDPANPGLPERDRFILSKGHAAPVLYAALAEAGYIDKALLPTLRKLGSPLQGHPDKRKLPFLEASTGSLGQGISLANGMAQAARLNRETHQIFVLIGDGESDEGQIWEAAMYAGYHGLDNVNVILDMNGYQLDDSNKAILNLEPIVDKWKAFNWNVMDVDGHDMAAVLNALEKAKAHKGSPTVVIARTVKGKGVSFMENNNKFHGVAPTEDELRLALTELENERTQLS
jgi:transketolase